MSVPLSVCWSVCFCLCGSQHNPCRGGLTTSQHCLCLNMYSLHFNTVYCYRLVGGGWEHDKHQHPFLHQGSRCTKSCCHFTPRWRPTPHCVQFVLRWHTPTSQLVLQRRSHSKKEKEEAQMEIQKKKWERGKEIDTGRDNQKLISAGGWHKQLSCRDWTKPCVWVWPGPASNSDCLLPCEWVWPVLGTDFDSWWLCGRVRSSEWGWPAGDSCCNAWGSCTLPQVRRRRTGTRGSARWRSSGGGVRRRGTWAGWSEDATEAPRCCDSAVSSRCFPSPLTPGG